MEVEDSLAAAAVIASILDLSVTVIFSLGDAPTEGLTGIMKESWLIPYQM